MWSSVRAARVRSHRSQLDPQSPREVRLSPPGALRFCLPILLLCALSSQLPAHAQIVTAQLITSAADSPVDIRNAGDDRLFIVEQEGRVRILRNGVLATSNFLNIASLVEYDGSERGLLSLAFDPNYPTVPYFWVYYTSAARGNIDEGDVIVARYQVSADPNTADASDPNVVLIHVERNSSSSNHNGGQLQFSPIDGYLYFAPGDGGGGCDSVSPRCNAQRDNSFLGKMLRIDPHRETAPYYNIPSTNPFVGAGDPLDEIWAKGLRNPYRFSFDRVTGDLWIGDVGQQSREEIDRQLVSSDGGENYGWVYMEGNLCDTCSTICTGLTDIPCNDPSLTLPVHDYPRSIGSIVIGGYVYRGSEIPFLQGMYVFGDAAEGDIWYLNPANPGTRNILLTGHSGLTSFGEDQNGELYFSLLSGQIYRIVGDATATPTRTPDPNIPTFTPTFTRTPTITRTPSFTRTPTRTRTETRTRTPTRTPTPTQSETPVQLPSETPTETPAQPTETPTVTTVPPTATITATPTISPTGTQPTATPTEVVTLSSQPGNSMFALAALALLLGSSLLLSRMKRTS